MTRHNEPLQSRPGDGESYSSGYRLFYDEALSRPTSYSAESDYFLMARDRMDRSFGLIEPYVAGSRMVDLGASPFYLLYRAKAQGAQTCHGVYFAHDAHPLRGVNKIFCDHGMIEISHTNIETENLPFPDDSVDIVTACEVLEHCDHFPARFAAEVRRVLRPGGVLLITVPNVNSIGNILHLLFRKNIYMRYRSDTTGRHKHEYTASQLRDFVRFLGFDVLRAGYLPAPTSPKFHRRPAYRALAAIPGLKHYSPVLYILARVPDPKRTGPLPAPPQSLYEDVLSIES